MLKKLMMAMMGPKAVAKMMGKMLKPMHDAAQKAVEQNDTVEETVPALNKELSKFFYPPKAPAYEQANIEQLKAENTGSQSLKVGDTVQDFMLPDQTGQQVRLSDHLKKGPVILTFYRGRWCPYCNVELRSLQRTLDTFNSLGASLIAVSPQTVAHTQAFATEAPLRFHVLADVGLHVAEQFGVVYKLNQHENNVFNAFGMQLETVNGKEGADRLPLPATFIINTDGKVAYAFIDPDYSKRAEPAELINALKSIRQPQV